MGLTRPSANQLRRADVAARHTTDRQLWVIDTVVGDTPTRLSFFGSGSRITPEPDDQLPTLRIRSADHVTQLLTWLAAAERTRALTTRSQPTGTRRRDAAVRATTGAGPTRSRDASSAARPEKAADPVISPATAWPATGDELFALSNTPGTSAAKTADVPAINHTRPGPARICPSASEADGKRGRKR